MPIKGRKPLPKSLCDKHECNVSSKTNVKMPRKVLISKKWHTNCSHEVKTKSAGFIESKTPGKQPKKTSNSLPVVPKNNKILDFCRTCGDTDYIETAVAVFSNTMTSSTSKTSALTSKNSKHAMSAKNSQLESKTDSQNVKVETKVVKEYYKNKNYDDSKSTIGYSKKSSKSGKINSKFKKGTMQNNKNDSEIEDQSVQEHYLNEKFADLYDSMHDFDTIVRNGQVLDTITEVNEKQTSEPKSTLSHRKSSVESNAYIFEPSDSEACLKRLKEFREKNYFECHSSKNRVQSKGSVISLKDHKCRYRLYLNDRLFPVAIDDDHNDNIRCVDCHLPLQAREANDVNGTIQAKVKLGSETQDMVLLLPIKEPLIIKQKKKERNDDDVVYFGLVRMDQTGNSLFSPSLPSQSLALRYQKGFRQFNDVQNYRYDKIKDSDVIYV